MDWCAVAGVPSLAAEQPLHVATWIEGQTRTLTEPVAVRRNGRDRLVLLSVDEYRRLKQRDWPVLRLEDFTEDDLKAILAVEPSATAAAFYHEVNG